MTHVDLSEMVDASRPFVAPTILLRILHGIPEFEAAWQRLRDLVAPLWERIDDEATRAVSRLQKGEDIQAVISDMPAPELDGTLGSLWGQYTRGLEAICQPLGSPRLLPMVMMLEDARKIPAHALFPELMEHLMNQPRGPEPGSWPWIGLRYLETSIVGFMGMNSPLDLLTPGAATRARHQMDRAQNQFVRSLMDPDPFPPLACWTAVKVFRRTTNQAVSEMNWSPRWVPELVRRGSQMLGVKSKRGRPSSSDNPVAAWARMAAEKGTFETYNN